MMNPQAIFQMKSLWDRFSKNHPKFVNFIFAAKGMPYEEGTIIEVSIKSPDGQEIASNLKLSAEDLELIQQAKSLNM